MGDRELVRAVLADWRTAPISEKERALLSFIDNVNRTSVQIRQEDIDALKGRGWSEEALYDAVTVCALFNLYNRWIDATGVPDMPAAAYEMSGKRLAEQGYAQVLKCNDGERRGASPT